MDQTALKPRVILTLAIALFSIPHPSQAIEPQTTQIRDESGVIGGSVSRSTFTEAVVNREPKNRITELPNNKQFIYYFTELKGMAGQNITHRWLLNGKPMYEMKFNIGSPRWRIWSSLPLQKEWLGNWETQVVNETGRVVRSDHFNYVQASVSPGK